MIFSHRTWAEIDTNALVHNLNIIKSKAKDSKIMAVVKANAYGHCTNIIAPILEKNGADSFAVSNIDEALQLREIGIKKPILILGYTLPQLAKTLCDNNISQCVYSLEYAKELSKAARDCGSKINIHIKLDTGMSRLGFDCRNDKLSGINDAIESAKLEGFLFEGLFTHFAESDRNISTDDGFTDEQFKRFNKAIENFNASGLKPKFCHCCNSAALILDNNKHLDISRPGIILYGLSPSDTPELECNLLPVMTLKSVVSMVKEIESQDTVSYGRTFKADRKMRVATVSIGYADGYPRLLSNKAYVIINGKKANILGRVCMDQLSVDVTDIPETRMGDEVILFGKELSVDILAELCGTINYEIVCGISPRVPRIEI